jgi:hypothetical protein
MMILLSKMDQIQGMPWSKQFEMKKKVAEFLGGSEDGKDGLRRGIV